jgi:hypothetical protein
MGLDYHLTFFKGIFLLIIAYAITLQLTDPWTNFPFSDAAKESLRFQAQFLVHWASLTSSIYMMIFIFLISILLFIRTVIRAKMHFSPAFSAKVEKRRVARLAKIRAREEEEVALGHSEVRECPRSNTRSARSVWTEVAVSFLIGTVCVLNDAIYNRPEGTAVLEGALTRFRRNAAWSALAVGVELAFFSLFFIVTVIVNVYRARRGQIKLDGDEELRVGMLAETAEANVAAKKQVPVTLSAGFDEKLIEIEDDIEKFSEKMSQTQDAKPLSH